MVNLRKDIAITPNTKMKQLQWDKLPHQQINKTVFNDDEPNKENEWVKKLQLDGVWMEMEEDFKAKQLVINLMGRLLLVTRYPLYSPNIQPSRSEPN